MAVKKTATKSSEVKVAKTKADQETKKTSQKTTKAKGPVFSKGQLVKAKAYRGMEDMLNALLDPNQDYTREEVDQIVETFKKGKVD